MADGLAGTAKAMAHACGRSTGADSVPQRAEGESNDQRIRQQPAGPPKLAPTRGLEPGQTAVTYRQINSLSFLKAATLEDPSRRSIWNRAV